MYVGSYGLNIYAIIAISYGILYFFLVSYGPCLENRMFYMVSYARAQETVCCCVWAAVFLPVLAHPSYGYIRLGFSYACGRNSIS